MEEDPHRQRWIVPMPNDLMYAAVGGRPPGCAGRPPGDGSGARGYSAGASYSEKTRRANPLLVASVFIAAIIEGLEQSLDPGPQTKGNGYEVAPDSGSMPDDWAEAIRVAKKSSFLKEALGKEMHHTYVAVKEAEYIRVMRSIPEIDYELYLYTV